MTRAESDSSQWKARKCRTAVVVDQGAGTAPAREPSRLTWRKANSAAIRTADYVERDIGAGAAEAHGKSMIVLAKATMPVNKKPSEEPLPDAEQAGERPTKLRLLAVDEDAGDLVPIAADDEGEADEAPQEGSSDEPARPKRRPAKPTEIESDASLQDEFAMGPTEPEPKCPTVKDLRPIDEITNDVEPEPGPFPQECPLGGDAYEPRHFQLTTFTWKASALCHKPLYFEQVQMERYGHTFGPIVQPIFSGAHFFVSVVALPYKMGVEPPLECVYPLGYYRPGSCAPRTVGPIPISARGVAAQLGVSTALTYLFP